MPVLPAQIQQVRAFNRDYTRRIGVLSQGLLGSPYSLTEVRVMYELAHRPGVTAGALGTELGLDRGYLSRILKGFEAQHLLARDPAAHDARRRHLRLTSAGRRVFAPLERRSQRQVRAMLAALDDPHRQAVLGAMDTIRQAFGDTSFRGPLILRRHRPGDMGWVVERHGALYHQEYGWNEEFEALVAKITAEFIANLNAARERCWIAEDAAGRRLGCIFLVAGDAGAAKLRLLLVEPRAPAGGRVRALRAHGGLRADRAVDAGKPHRGASSLPTGGLCAQGERAAPQLWQGSHRGELAAAACPRFRQAFPGDVMLAARGEAIVKGIAP
jgi:DNA-binding MarR family transcriptional regulator